MPRQRGRKPGREARIPGGYPSSGSGGRGHCSRGSRAAAPTLGSGSGLAGPRARSPGIIWGPGPVRGARTRRGTSGPTAPARRRQPGRQPAARRARGLPWRRGSAAGRTGGSPGAARAARGLVGGAARSSEDEDRARRPGQVGWLRPEGEPSPGAEWGGARLCAAAAWVYRECRA